MIMSMALLCFQSIQNRNRFILITSKKNIVFVALEHLSKHSPLLTMKQRRDDDWLRASEVLRGREFESHLGRNVWKNAIHGRTTGEKRRLFRSFFLLTERAQE